MKSKDDTGEVEKQIVSDGRHDWRDGCLIYQSVDPPRGQEIPILVYEDKIERRAPAGKIVVSDVNVNCQTSKPSKIRHVVRLMAEPNSWVPAYDHRLVILYNEWGYSLGERGCSDDLT